MNAVATRTRALEVGYHPAPPPHLQHRPIAVHGVPYKVEV